MKITIEISNLDIRKRIKQFTKGKYNVDMIFKLRDSECIKIYFRNGKCLNEKILDDLIENKPDEGIVEIDIIDEESIKFYIGEIEKILKANSIVENYTIDTKNKNRFFEEIGFMNYLALIFEKGFNLLVRYKTLYINVDGVGDMGRALSIVKAIQHV
ncbi:hypothetical protein DRP43_06040 [candidate division TA06 bacterium]|uniref:Uncharacterized protein n=1 Tax=candidate division TA06 bacterium TaxID=2250710 RepID=A0A660SCD2_UNCT6|nr:MAG: hypothetical protein DRP43_06040 [candidate division TA06 bacterium]